MFLLNLVMGLQMIFAASSSSIYFDYPTPANYNFKGYALVQSWGMRISNCGGSEFECQAFSTPLLLQRPDGRFQKAKLFYDCDVVKGPSHAGNYECLYKDSPAALFISKEIYNGCEPQDNFDKVLCH